MAIARWDGRRRRGAKVTSFTPAAPTTNGVHAALAGNAAAAAFPGPFTNPALARNLRVVFATGYDGGDVTVTGTWRGNAAQETFTAGSNVTRVGAKIFDAVTGATKTGAVAAAGLLTCLSRSRLLVAATGSITCVAPDLFTDGDTVTIDDGDNAPTVFEIDLAGDGVAMGHVAVDISAATVAADVQAAFVAAINGVGATLKITASPGAGASVTLTHDLAGADHAGAAVTTTSAAAGFSVAGMSGGTDGASAQTFTLNDGTHTKVFEFDTDGSVGAARVIVDLSGTSALAAIDVAGQVASAINGVGAGLTITATDNGDGTVTLANDAVGTNGNHAITETVTDAGFLVAGMSGGTGANSAATVSIGTGSKIGLDPGASDSVAILSVGGTGEAVTVDATAGQSGFTPTSAPDGAKVFVLAYNT